jgi:hypothetical protein
VPQRKVSRFVRRVEGARALAALRRGERRVLSVGMLVEAIGGCFAMTTRAVGRTLSVKPAVWEALVTGTVEPDAIGADRYARLAKRFGVGFELVCEAIMGSHMLRRLGSSGAAPRFAHSDRERRCREERSSLKDAYDELRLESNARDGSVGPDPRIERFIEEVRECSR